MEFKQAMQDYQNAMLEENAQRQKILKKHLLWLSL